MMRKNPALNVAPITDEPYLAAEFVFSAEHEMVTSLTDLLTRRTRAHLHNARTTFDAAEKIGRLVAPVLNWDDDEVRQQVDAYRSLVDSEFAAAGLRVS
jgi:glycerol-3-phosphate dehydrogenase